MEAVTVDPARETEAAACLALLPEAVGLPAELLIAKRAHAIVGAAAVHWRNVSQPPGFPLAIHVLPPERRQGIGRLLLDAAIDLALVDTDGFWSLKPVADASAAAFLLACGFEARRQEHHFEAAIDALLADVAPRSERLRARGRVPGDLKLAPLAQAPLEEVGRLVARALGSAPAHAAEQLRRRVDGAVAFQDRSRVALRDGRVEGVILWQITDGVAVVEARVVHPRNRGGWLNAVLLEDGLVRGKAEGLDRLRFHCEDSVRDTLSLARRCDAVETGRPAFYYRPFEG